MAWESKPTISQDDPVTVDYLNQGKDNEDYLYGLLGPQVTGQIRNPSFEIDADEDGQPDGWTIGTYSGGSFTLDETNPSHGLRCAKFTHPGGAGNGGGYMDSEYIEVSELSTYILGLVLWATAAGMKLQVYARWYDDSKSYLSETQLYSSTSNPTSETRYAWEATAVSGARYVKLRLIGGYNDTDVAGSAYFDDLIWGRLDDGIVRQSTLKTSQGSVSHTVPQDSTYGENYTLPGGEYGFQEQIKTDIATNWTSNEWTRGDSIYPASYVTNIYMLGVRPAAVGSGIMYAQQRYVTSSGKEHWLFILKDDAGMIRAMYEAPDHPCFGNGNDPEKVPHPFVDYWNKPLPAGWEIVLADMDSINAAKGIARAQGKGLLDIVKEKFEVDDSAELPFEPRNLHGKRFLQEKSDSYKVRALKLK